MATILITGCSSGFGLETARLFLDRGWNVVAAMRRPDSGVLPESDNLRIVQLDVTDIASVARAVSEAGPIDVLVNNAGFGAPAPIELIDLAMARSLLETNTLGTLAMLQATLPAFRERRAGVVINVSSSTTLKALPLIGLYRASKMAVNAMTESLAEEMKPFGVRVHLVIPGRAPDTRFGESAFPHLQGHDNADYAPMIENVVAAMRDSAGPTTQLADVTEAIWRIANDPASPFRTAAGADAEAWMAQAK